MAKLTTEKNVPPMLFYKINLAQLVFMFKRNHIASQKFLMLESRESNRIDTELEEFVT